jgi:hypothetical protein
MYVATTYWLLRNNFRLKKWFWVSSLVIPPYGTVGGIGSLYLSFLAMDSMASEFFFLQAIVVPSINAPTQVNPTFNPKKKSL